MCWPHPLARRIPYHICLGLFRFGLPSNPLWHIGAPSGGCGALAEARLFGERVGSGPIGRVPDALFVMGKVPRSTPAIGCPSGMGPVGRHMGFQVRLMVARR